jgi:hypothetical protein
MVHSKKQGWIAAACAFVFLAIGGCGESTVEQKGECAACSADAECGPGLLCGDFMFPGDPNVYHRCSTAPSTGGSDCTS